MGPEIALALVALGSALVGAWINRELERSAARRRPLPVAPSEPGYLLGSVWLEHEGRVVSSIGRVAMVPQRRALGWMNSRAVRLDYHGPDLPRGGAWIVLRLDSRDYIDRTPTDRELHGHEGAQAVLAQGCLRLEISPGTPVPRPGSW